LEKVIDNIKYHKDLEIVNILDIIMENPWNENLVLSSVPMWKLDGTIPIANAAGCFVTYKGSRFLISVAHATIAESEWHFEASNRIQNPETGQWGVFFRNLTMSCLTEFKLIPETNDFTIPELVDFTYRKVPENTESEHVLQIVNNERIAANRTVFNLNYPINPSTMSKYGFFGNIKFGGLVNNTIIYSLRIENNLSYIGEEGNYYIFKLPHKYGSHENYIGCSGAPIIDENNNLVALVAFGDREKNAIYGIKIEKYLAALEIEANPNL